MHSKDMSLNGICSHIYNWITYNRITCKRRSSFMVYPHWILYTSSQFDRRIVIDVDWWYYYTQINCPSDDWWTRLNAATSVDRIQRANSRSHLPESTAHHRVGMQPAAAAMRWIIPVSQASQARKMADLRHTAISTGYIYIQVWAYECYI
jgi:hypothetical protein